MQEESCFKCHVDLADANHKDPAVSIARSVHADAKVTCSSCHGGNPTATSARVAHGGNFSGKPSSLSTVYICGSCHKQPAENYAKGPHNFVGPKKTHRRP
ncbi:MAG: multiheme c-type cytochrome, partial [Candidatus Poribacteria bacterium]